MNKLRLKLKLKLSLPALLRLLVTAEIFSECRK